MTSLERAARLRATRLRATRLRATRLRAARLRQEAEHVLQLVQVYEILRPYGQVYPTGSYYLDLLVYPDIDLMLTPVSIPQLFEIAAQLARSPLVFQVAFEKSSTPDLPGGLYLKPRIAYGEWGRPWKIDLWSLDEALIAEKLATLQRYQQKLSEPLRDMILTYKLSILQPNGRTPMYSGHYIYQAFLDEGLSDFGEVTEYLKRNGIEVS